MQKTLATLLLNQHLLNPSAASYLAAYYKQQQALQGIQTMLDTILPISNAHPKMTSTSGTLPSGTSSSASQDFYKDPNWWENYDYRMKALNELKEEINRSEDGSIHGSELEEKYLLALQAALQSDVTGVWDGNTLNALEAIQVKGHINGSRGTLDLSTINAIISHAIAGGGAWTGKAIHAVDHAVDQAIDILHDTWEAVGSFSSGAWRTAVSALTNGLSDVYNDTTNTGGNETAYAVGQIAGGATASILGAIETLLGIGGAEVGIATSETGVGVLIAASSAAAAAHGAVSALNGVEGIEDGVMYFVKGDKRTGNGTSNTVNTVEGTGKIVGSVDGLTSAEKTVINDLVSQGKTVEVIPKTTASKTPDFLVNGVKTELKTLENPNINTGITRIQKGFKQGAETVIIDGRSAGLSTEQAQQIINSAKGTYPNKTIPGKVEIWTNDGIITFP